MIAVFALLSAFAGGYASSGQVLACQLFHNEADVGDGVVHVVDLRLVTNSDEEWTFETADGAKGVASVKWLDGQRSIGKVNWSGGKPIGKISEVLVLSNGWVEGADYLWLKLEGKEAFQTPAYGCHTRLGNDR